MHIYRSRFLVRGEVWFDHEADQTPVDWIFYRQRSRPVPGARYKRFETRVLDLNQSSQALLEQMSKGTSYKIRRARDRDGVRAECLDPSRPGVLDHFERTYERFAALKGLSSLDRPLLDELAKERFLELSVVRDAAGQPLSYHAYYRDANRSCLLHAVSLYQTLSDSGARNVMGRANRYLFWCDILRHQADGLRTFDFGGWYPGKTDAQLLEINHFKEGFGGRVVQEYNCQQILSLKGGIVLRCAALLAAGKHLLGSRRADLPPREADLAASTMAEEPRPTEETTVSGSSGLQRTSAAQ